MKQVILSIQASAPDGASGVIKRLRTKKNKSKKQKTTNKRK